MAKHMRAQQLSTPMVEYKYTPVGVEAIPIIQKKKQVSTPTYECQNISYLSYPSNRCYARDLKNRFNSSNCTINLELFV